VNCIPSVNQVSKARTASEGFVSGHRFSDAAKGSKRRRL